MNRSTTGLDPFARRCIATGAILMLAGVILGAFGAHLLEVVDLAVEDDADRAVLVEQRLLPGGEVDDREPPVRQARSLTKALSVKATLPAAISRNTT